MKSLVVKFENCYGIKKLEHTFNFDKSNIFSIYAPNGTMKTSFAKACKDLSKGQISKDSIFPKRVSARAISDENGVELEAVEIFVIEPYDAAFKSERITSLLVNNDLKEEYDNILNSIETEKTAFYNKLKQLSGLSGRNNNIELEIINVFGQKPILELLLEIEATLADYPKPRFTNIIYSKIFDEKVLAFLNTKDFKKQIKDYIQKYNSLIDASKYLKRGFNHSNVTTIQKNLKDNGFFKAQHSLNLFNGVSKDEVDSEERLLEIVSEEMNKVLNDKEIQEKFNEIDSKLTTAQLREFRDYLLDNKDITVELADLDKFKKEIWISYFIEQKTLLDNLLTEYKTGKVKIESIIKSAKGEATEWKCKLPGFSCQSKV